MDKKTNKVKNEKELLNEIIEKLKNDSKEKIILVEGKKDKKALEILGISNIIIINDSFYKIIETIIEKNKECIILVDLDKEGKKIYSKISSKLRENGVKIDDKYRNLLFKTKLRQIEGINTYLNTIDA